MYDRLIVPVLVSEIPAPVEALIVPPVPALPVPVTLRPPDAPVVLRTIPLVAPFAEILRNSRLFALIVVFATLNAVPVVVVILLIRAPVAAPLQGFSSQTSTVPPPVAAKAALPPVESVRPPENRTVAPVLPLKETPLPSPSSPSVMAPSKLLVPAVAPLTETSWPTSSVIV